MKSSKFYPLMNSETNFLELVREINIKSNYIEEITFTYKNDIR